MALIETASPSNHRECWITMNDGVRLDASIFTPTTAQPEQGWPAILLVHGHGDISCKASMFERALHYVQRDYLVVAYSVRGQGSSEGLTFHLGAREIFDLQDVIDWMLAELPDPSAEAGRLRQFTGGLARVHGRGPSPTGGNRRAGKHHTRSGRIGGQRGLSDPMVFPAHHAPPHYERRSARVGSPMGN